MSHEALALDAELVGCEFKFRLFDLVLVRQTEAASDHQPEASNRAFAVVNRPAMLLWGLERQKWAPASSGSSSLQSITRDRVFFQRNPVSGTNQALGGQDAGSWAAGNSLGADKFSNRLTLVLRHGPPRSATGYRASRRCLEFAACFCLSWSADHRFVTECIHSCQLVKWLTQQNRGLHLRVGWFRI
jgi:hypothetical protein